MKENAFFWQAFQIVAAMEVMSNYRFRDFMYPKCCSRFCKCPTVSLGEIFAFLASSLHVGKNTFASSSRFITALSLSLLLSVLSPLTGNFQVCSYFCNSHFLFYEGQHTFDSFHLCVLKSSVH